jgi:TolB protein
MGTRRLLMVLAGGLAALVLVGGVVVAALAFTLLRAPASASQLLVLGDDQQIRLVPESGAAKVVAADASSDLFRYPSVTPDGRFMAYISSDDQGFAIVRLDIRSGAKNEIYRSRDNPPLYLSWSPDGKFVSFLTNMRTGGLGIHVVSADGSRPSDLIGTTMGTSYFAWRPDGGTLLVHTGGNQFQEGRMSSYSPGSTEPEALRNDPGLFQAPAWSTSGREFYYVAQPAVEGGLTIDQVESVLTRVSADGSNPQALVSERGAALFFARAPQSDQIAYTTVSPQGFGALKLIDPASGESTAISTAGEQVAAFFWAPDGQRIAYISVSPPADGQPPQYAWHVVAISGGKVQDFDSFVPSQAFAAMLSYFDAYAISLQLWSANSAELVYGAADGVYVLNTESGETRRAADGVLGMWVERL